MIKALFTSATGLNAQQIVVDSTSNNLANVNTTGFKRSQPDFQDLLYITQRSPGAEVSQGVTAPTGLQIGSGVRVAGNTKIHTQGSLDPTNNPTDVAIEGEGFFKVQLPGNEVRYTRDGTLRRNATGELVTSDGYAIQPGIIIPPTMVEVNIGEDGTVSGITAGATAPTTVGKLTLVRFANPSGLSSEGRNLLAETAASGSPNEAQAGQAGAGTIRKGFLERSNVEVVRELVNLILAQRAYEFNTRAIRAADEMLSYTNNLSR